MKDFFDDVLAPIGFVVFILGLIVGCIMLMCYLFQSPQYTLCKARHDRTPYKVTRSYGQDANGCEIQQLDLWDEDCDFQQTIYTTTCQGKVHWEIHHSHGRVERHDSVTQ